MRNISRLIAVALVTAVASYGAPALAQDSTVSVDKLMQPGPLGDVWLGVDTAPVTIIEYASMTCPHCAAFANTVFDQFVAKYVDTGLVHYTMREFPIDPPNYPLSAAAFMLARCAPGENGYFGMIALLFAQQPMWAGVQDPIAPLQQLALQQGIDADAFNACLTNQDIIDAVYWNYNNGIDLGVNGTPTFFINGTRYTGELTLDQMDRILEPLLPATPAAPAPSATPVVPGPATTTPAAP